MGKQHVMSDGASTDLSCFLFPERWFSIFTIFSVFQERKKEKKEKKKASCVHEVESLSFLCPDFQGVRWAHDTLFVFSLLFT